jgi:hypothetical protein
MSLFDDASLVMIPIAYKDGKLYSIKPTDGSGDFTFTRGSNLAATRVNSSGLIEKGRENLLLQSNQFDTTWATTDASVTSGQSGYDGSSDAWLLSKTDSNALISQSVSKSGVQTYSIYAKAGTLSWCSFLITATTGNQSRYFDLSTGTKGGSDYGTEIESTITSVGSGWHRITLTFNESTTSVRIYPADGNLDISGTSGNILIQDAQLEQGLVATDYIETTTTTAQAGILEDMARLDYSGGASCPSLLLEPQRTNLALYSEQFDNAAWAKSNATVTANATTSPEGYVNAYKLITNNAVINGQITDNISKSASQITYTSSIFVKKAEWDRIGLYISDASTFNNRGQAFFNLDGTLGTVAAAGTFTNASSNIEEYPNDWYRVYLTVTVPSTTTTIVLRYYSLDNNELNGDGTSGIYIYGAQLEEGSLTSYIPTYGTSQTRSKDSCIKTGISSLIGQTEGTLFAEFEIPVNTQNGDIIAIRNGASSANGIFVSYRSSSVVQLIVRTGSTNALIFQRIGSYPSGKNKIAVAYKNGDFAISLNGTAAQVNTSSITMPTSLDSVALFGDNLYAQTLPVPYAPVLLFKTRLTNAELADLTTI